ncbi:class I SAM-dependent methyltransferase [Solwaraspora sp. WMMD791]|uniref:class I SAM-dependent methyltransferase n=1 Tax=Solwaraspora sp. WMMD791 TaxID=3016086 RepID=UPI00249A8013|nr:class I SAM-dependent methyltransferase [Solwaraspora sp. WMMD791]WFE26122.1 class I SAM-dependent methyltransferase [Solwaraspora sp. WMMD791]
MAGYDFQSADFDAAYRGQDLLPGAGITRVPWDIAEAQSAVIEMERAGWFRGRVLDVGCGLGDNAIFLAGRGYETTAVDAAPSAIEEARRRAGDRPVEFAIADATHLAGYEGGFDTALDSAFYHTLTAEDRSRYLIALHRATRAGAHLNMLCFADVPGGMPAPLAVTEADVRTGLTAGGWRVVHMSRAEYAGLAAPMQTFFERLGRHPKLDQRGRTRLPVWLIRAERVEA